MVENTLFTTGTLINWTKKAENMVFNMFLSMWRNNDNDSELRKYKKISDRFTFAPTVNECRKGKHPQNFWKNEKSRQKRSHENDKKCLRRYLRQKCLNDSTDFFIGEKYPLPNPSRKIAKDTQKSPKIHNTKERQTITKKKFLFKHDKNIGSSRFCDGKNHKNFIRMFRNFMWWNFQVMPTAFLSIVYHSWPKNKSKNSPNLGICGWQNNGSLQKSFSNSEIENWGKLGACPNYFRFWKGNNCGCGNGISTQFSQRVLLSFHPSNLSANPKIGAVFSTKKTKDCVYLQGI